jgi:trans-aconitate 2-methyltransferase
MATVWDPAQYLHFSGERLRPALDLLAQVPLAAPARVADLGCGPGNVTAIIRARFPDAEVTGLDSSAAMLERARRDVPDCRFEQTDAARWTPAAPPDLIYSNAALHWLSDHETLFPRLVSLLAPGGCLAVQMPAMHDAPLRALQYEVASRGAWAPLLAGVGSAPPILDPGAYWDLLRPITASLDLWDTTYTHALRGDDAVVQWAMGTSLRPFLSPLAGAMRAGFLAAYAETIRPHYPKRADGTTLLPFQRRFIAARIAG